MTPTDVAAWIASTPQITAALLAIIAIAGVLENTERGRRWTERAIRWVLR